MSDLMPGRAPWWREPLLQFLVIGALVAAGQAWWTAHRDASTRRIVVDEGRIAALRGLHEAQFGQPPTPAELQHLVQAHVREEVLYREALARGLDQDDEILRRRLVGKLEFLLTDAAVPDLPADTVLQQHLQRHPERFAAPGRINFHNRFAPDRAAAEALRATLPAKPAVPGRLGSDGTDPWQADMALADVQARFGRSPLAEALPALPLQQWSGPLQSGLGWHWVYVESRSALVLPGLVQVRDAVLADWMTAERERLTRQAVDALVAGYAVELPERLTATP
jgi:peptidyl-prolyl cis-trans isomerase C